MSGATASDGRPPVATLVERLLAGEAAALARAITAVENAGPEMAEILGAIQPRLGHARVVGFTGPPGAGKSTLVSAYVGELRRHEQTVGVVAVDPSSPLSGGAILGDRIRMVEHTSDPGVFVRSLASRGHMGGLARSAAHVIDVMDAAGRDVIVLETVGAGQSEVEVAEAADTTVVVCAPGQGDDVQAIKAGILEVADILVVNKADLLLAERTARQLRSMLGMREASVWEVPVLLTTATTGAGVGELAEAVERHATSASGRRAHDPGARVRRLLAGVAGQLVHDRVAGADGDAGIAELCGAVQRGELDFDAAARRLLEQRWRDDG